MWEHDRTYCKHHFVRSVMHYEEYRLTVYITSRGQTEDVYDIEIYRKYYTPTAWLMV